MPQKSIVSKSRDKNPLATKLFGENALKDNLSDQIFPNPLVVFCRNHKNQEFTGFFGHIQGQTMLKSPSK